MRLSSSFDLVGLIGLFLHLLVSNQDILTFGFLRPPLWLE